MRWAAKSTLHKHFPESGALKCTIKFAFIPHLTHAASGEHGWDAEWIWWEKLVKVEHWGYLFPKWFHDNWYPLNDFTQSLVNQSNG